MTDDYTVFQKREDYRENEIWAEEILEHVRQHPGCDRGTFDAISHRDAAEEADRMVNAGKLDRWYTGTVPAYYIPGTYRPPHLIADTEDAQEGVIPLALSISEHVGVAKWTRYEQPIERVLDCCNIIKEAK